MVSIITVDYKQPELTMQLLHSINRHTAPGEVEVIVVDNGAVQDHGDRLKSVYPSLIYLRSEKNLGFAGGNNLGIRHANGDYLLFLNNDTEITAGFTQALREELDAHPEIGLLSPLILYFDDRRKVQYAGYTPMNYFTGRNKEIGATEDDNGQHDQVTRQTGYVHGAAMLCRRADLQRVGLMDEHFFLYYEELDWCEKFKRAGLKIGFTGKAKIYHKESMSVGKESPLKTYFMVRNRWLFIRRNATRLERLVFGAYYLGFAIPVLLLKCLVKGRYDLAKAAIRGVRWNLTHGTSDQELGVTVPST